MERKALKKYRGIFFPMLTSIGVIIIVVALIYASIFHWVTLEKNRAVFSRELQSCMDQTALSMQNAMTVLQQLSCDSTAYRLMDYPQLTPSELMRAHAQLKRYMNVDPSIAAIYLYKASAQTVFVGGSLFRQSEYTLDTLPDADFADCLQRDQITSGVGPIPRVLTADHPQYSPKSQNVFTMLYTLSPSGTFAQHDTVAIHFIADALIAQPASHGLGTLMIYTTDEDDVTYASCDPAIGLQLAQSAKGLPEGESGIRRVVLQKQEYTLFVRKDAVFGWTALMAVPNALIDRDNLRAVSISMSICGGLALLAGFLSWLASRRIYRKTGLEEMKQIKEQNQRQQYLLQRQVIRNIIDGRHFYEKEELEELLSRQEIHLKAERSTLALLLRVDGWKAFCVRYGSSHMEELFQWMMEQAAGLEGNAAGSFLLRGQLCLLYQPLQQDINQSTEALLSLGGRMQQLVQERCQTTLSVMVSPQPRPLYEWCSHISVLEEAQYIDRLFQGYGRLLIQPFTQPGEQQYPKQQERAILSALKMGDFAQARESYYDFVRQISIDRLHYINLALVHLCLMLDESIALIVQNNHLPAEPHDFDILIDFDSAERIEEIDRQFFQVFDRLESAMLSRRSTRQQEMAEQIEAYIKTHYGDVNLCRQQVCDTLDISYASAGVAFKKAYDTSIAAYILQFRLKQACLLLEEAADTLENVAIQCGFSNLGHFYKMFKREYGIPPGEYRKIHSKRA